MPKVSIGMPVYNGEKYISEAIESLLTQSFRDFELIISDNHSSDSTKQICQKYSEKDARVIYFQQSQNIGAAKNFAYVLHKASSEHFMWASSDDIWHINWLNDLYELISNKKSTAAFGQVIPIDESSKSLEHIAVGLKYKFSGPKLIRRLLFFLADESAGKANIAFSLYPIAELRKVNIENYNYDYSLIYELLSRVDYDSANNVFLYKRDHEEAAGNLSKHQDNKARWLLRQFFPIPVILLKEYMKLSTWYEKPVIIFFLPFKILNAYKARLRTLLLRINSIWH